MFPFPLSESIHNTNLIRTITADDGTVIILSVKLVLLWRTKTQKAKSLTKAISVWKTGSL